MQNIFVLDKNVKNTAHQNCTISILTGQDGYCFSVKDRQENRFMGLRSVSLDKAAEPAEVIEGLEAFIRDIWGEDKPVDIKHLVMAGAETLLLPKAFSQGNSLKEIMAFHFPDRTGKEIVSTSFPQQDFILAGLVDEHLKNTLEAKTMPQKTELSQASLIRSALKYTGQGKKEAVFVQVWKGYADMLVFKNGVPALFNTYAHRYGNDLVYYVLNLYKQLMLDPKNCPLMFSGWIDKNETAMVQLNKFIKNIYLETLNTEKKYSYQFQDIMPHYFVNFLNVD
ncbi:MAG: DUF3822 family protein [Bacteroidota bacterium]